MDITEQYATINTTQKTIYAILRLIQTEPLQIGQRLPSERELAKRWNVSRNTVREAIKSLAFNNVLTIRSGSGTYLHSLPDYLIDTYQKVEKARDDRISDYEMQIEARKLIEVELIRLAALRATDEDLAKLQTIMDKMSIMIENKDYRGYLIEDFNFHICHMKIAKNHYLFDAVMCYWNDIVSEWFAFFGTVPSLEERSYAMHKAIFAAIQAHDAQKAMEAFQAHLDFTKIRYKHLELPSTPILAIPADLPTD